MYKANMKLQVIDVVVK